MFHFVMSLGIQWAVLCTGQGQIFFSQATGTCVRHRCFRWLVVVVCSVVLVPEQK